MSAEAVSKTIELVQGQIAELDHQLLEKKRMVNDLCRLAGQSPLYGDAELASSLAARAILPDAYYGKALATVVRLVLERRKASGRGAATVNEIYDDMVAGGYNFAGKNDENNKRGLYVSLGKNSYMFHKLPNGTYGLLDWYENVKESKEAKVKSNGFEAPKSTETPLHEELQHEAGNGKADKATATEAAPKAAK
jgi:hypothetical protein